MDSRKIKEFEENEKNDLFGELNKRFSEMNVAIAKIQEQSKCGLEIKNKLPNILITLNNKLVEMQFKFQEAGLSLYSGKVFGGVVWPSAIGNAVTHDLFDIADQGLDKLDDCIRIISQIQEQKLSYIESVKKANPLKRKFLSIKQEDLLFTQEEIDVINAYLDNYNDIDNQLFNYNLKDNVITSIEKELFNTVFIPSGMLETDIFPSLEKLGLSDLVPKHKENLIKIAEEATYELSKKIFKKYGDSLSDDNMFSEKNNFSLEEDSKRSVKR